MTWLRPLAICAFLVPMQALAQSAEEDDRGYVQALIEDALSDTGRTVRITGLEGALSSSARLGSLTVADADGVWLRMENAQLDWRRAALLQGRLEVDQLSAEQLIVARLPTSEESKEASGFSLPALPPPEASAFVLPELPVSIQIGEISIETLTLEAAVLGEAAELAMEGGASLANGQGDVTLSLERTDGRDGAFRLAGAFSNATEILDLSLVMTEAAGGIAATALGVPGAPSLDLRIEGVGPVSDFAADLSLATDGEERLGGKVAVLTTTADDPDAATEQSFTANLSGDLRPLLTPEYRSFFGAELAFDLAGARSEIGGLSLDRMDIRSNALNLTGQLALGVDGWPLRVAMDGSIADPDGGAVLLSIPGAPTRLDRAEFTFDYDAEQDDTWQLRLLTDALTRDGFGLGIARLDGSGTLMPGNGDLLGRVDGQLSMTLADLELADMDLSRAIGPRLRGGLAFVYEEDAPLKLSNIALGGPDYALAGQIEIALPSDRASPIITSDVRLSAADLSRFAGLAGAALAGRAQIDLAGTVRPLDGAFDLQLAGTSQDLSVGIGQLDPLLAGEGRVSVAATRDEAGTRLDRVSIATQQARITGNAALSSEASTGALDVQLADAALVHPDMTGPAQLDLSFDQRAGAWNADLSASGPGGLEAKLAARTPDATPDETNVSVQLGARDLSPYGWALDRAVSGGVTLTAEGRGDLGTQLGQLSVTGAVQDLRLGVEQLDTLLAGMVDVDLAARREAADVLVLDALTVSGSRLIVDASGSIVPERTRARFNVDLPNMGVLVPELAGALAAEGVVMTTGGNWDVDTRLTGPAGMTAEVTGAVASDAQSADLRVKGAVPLALGNRSLSPNIASGLARFDMALTGPLAPSSLRGTIQTDEARLSLPEQKIALDAIRSVVRLSGGRAQIDLGAAVSSGGQIAVSGPVDLAAPFNGDLDVRLQSISLVEPGLLETTANGQLSVRGPLSGGAQIAGRIDLGEVAVQIPDTAGSDTVSIPGLVHLNEPAAVRATRSRAGLIEAGGAAGVSGQRPFGLDVLISAPSRIFIRGRGLDAELGGSLRVAGTTAALAPAGQFELIRGRLSILGKRLVLSEAIIQPQGDLDPFMRVVATSSTSDIEVQFVIEGQISQPELTMTSSPALPDDEILSQFLFGRSLSSVSALQALQIANALATLSGRSGGALQKLREGIGLDDLDISSSETGETTVRAGRYLSENIYSDIGRTSDGETEINLNLTLTPSLTARGTVRSDSSTGIGIFFENDY